MSIIKRCEKFNILFDELQQTNSRNEKETTLSYFRHEYPELRDDLNYIFETLAGKHPIGWTFYATMTEGQIPGFTTIKECIQACERLQPKTVANTSAMEAMLSGVGFAIEGIVNRTLKLGIGNSQLSKSDITPMLAKKYEGQFLYNEVFVTEKLDGNRCVAHYDGDKWQFTSRSGKPLNVDFDMTGMNTDLIYDGEIMSDKQTAYSVSRHKIITRDLPLSDFMFDKKMSQLLFNSTSGMINQHGPKRGLVYNIFDIINKEQYHARRAKLNEVDVSYTKDIRIVPVLYTGKEHSTINTLLDKMVQMGGEGIMLNIYNRGYDHKRSDALLKYKQVQYIDMRVYSIDYGTGKYLGMVGALNCHIKREDGSEILCAVGTGLSDAQREQWAIDNSLILDKIVQVGYHELTQDKACIGTNAYSLRFPRLIRVREDKDSTSEY